MTASPLVLKALICLFWVGFCISSPEDHQYNVGDRVPFFVNKVGPLDNPSKTYCYYDLPFCRPDTLVDKKESLGEVLNGDRLMNSLYELRFRQDITRVTLCRKKLTASEVRKCQDSIVNEFYFQMYYDDLPFWGFIGKVEEEGLNKKRTKHHLFKHVRFDALYNGNRVVEIRAFSDPNSFVDISDGIETEVEFSYSVLWNNTSDLFENRMERYARAALHEVNLKTHWCSVVNSIFTVLLVTGVLAVVVIRHLKNDMRKYNFGDEEDKEVTWKCIEGDVFRCPRKLPLFCAILGSGTQLFMVVCLLFVLAFLSIIYPYSGGALYTSLMILYPLTSVVAGYVAASFHSQFDQTGWEKTVRLAGILYPGPLFITALILNTIAMSYGATAALSVGAIIAIVLVYSLVNIPLLVIGGVLGYRFRSKFEAPSTIKRLPREIPQQCWYRKTFCQIFLGGLIPYTIAALELHQLYSSLWGYKILILPGSLFFTFTVLVCITAILSITLTYIQISGEDYKWWWRSIIRGGASAIFMYVYSVYFYMRSNMSGVMQLSFFLGYNACMCYAFFLILGSVSFLASFIFVRHIYHAVKSD